MRLYHVNPYTGEPGECTATIKKCLYGTDEDHYTSPEAARAAYEKAQEQNKLSPEEVAKAYGIATAASQGLPLSGYTTHRLEKALDRAAKGSAAVKKAIEEELKLRKPSPKAAPVAGRRKLEFPKDFKDFEAQIKELVPDPKDSKLIAMPTVTNENYKHEYKGAKAGTKNADGSYMTQADVAKEIRNAVKEAKDLGELPSWVEVSARKNGGAWVSSISVTIGRKEGAKFRAIPEGWISRNASRYHPGDDGLQATRLYKYVSTLASQWESSSSDNFDNYHSFHAARVSWRSEDEDRWEDRQRAKK